MIPRPVARWARWARSKRSVGMFAVIFLIARAITTVWVHGPRQSKIWSDGGPGSCGEVPGHATQHATSPLDSKRRGKSSAFHQRFQLKQNSHDAGCRDGNQRTPPVAHHDERAAFEREWSVGVCVRRRPIWLSRLFHPQSQGLFLPYAKGADFARHVSPDTSRRVSVSPKRVKRAAREYRFEPPPRTAGTH